MKAKPHPCKGCSSPIPGRFSGRAYCSPECKARTHVHVPWNKGVTGIAANRPKNGRTIPCGHCGGTFYVPKKRADSGAQFCSMGCYHKSRWGGSRQEDRQCKICHAAFTVARSSQRTTCSDKCSRENKSRSHQGENSMFWRGGKTAPYVGEWKQRRKEALDRDGHKCTACGSDNRLNVHHIQPYRYSRSHALDNLTTLCRPCHSKEELKVNPLAEDAMRVRRWRKGSYPAPR